MSYIVEDANKTISNLCKLDQETKKCFQTILRLENSFFVQNCKEASPKSKKCQRICVIVIAICVIENKKRFLKTKNVFRRKLGLRNSLILQKNQAQLFQNQTM